MASQCWSSVRGKVARITRLDECGAPAYGPCAQIVTDGFVTVGYSPEVEEGDEITVKKANGALCVSDRSCDTLKRINLEIEFCQVQPELLAMMTGNAVVLDYKGDAVGNRVGTTIQCQGGFAIEVWSDIPGAVCETTGARQYGYFLLPFVTGGLIGEFTIENDAATFTVTGYSKEGSGWGQGPYAVDAQDADNSPGPLLTPIGAKDHMDMHLVTIAPPQTQCGCQPVVVDPFQDTDGDGLFDNQDPDIDGDGLLNTLDTDPFGDGGVAPPDSDGDGVPDRYDPRVGANNQPPGAPGNPLVEDAGAAGDRSVRVTWTPADGAQFYDVLVDGTPLATGVGGTTVVLNNIPPGPHTYVVRARNPYGQADSLASTYTEPVATTTPDPVTVADAGAAGDGQVQVSWTAVAGATSYDVLVDGVVQANDVAGTGPAVIGGVAAGPHSYQVIPNGAGSASAVYSFTEPAATGGADGNLDVFTIAAGTGDWTWESGYPGAVFWAGFVDGTQTFGQGADGSRPGEGFRGASGETHTYAIAAFDAANVEIARSTITLTTP